MLYVCVGVGAGVMVAEDFGCFVVQLCSDDIGTNDWGGDRDSDGYILLLLVLE